MTTDRDVNTSRTAVKTYVPTYQKRRWKSHAEELGMSQSEFVRTMVQAGRRGFSPPDSADAAGESASSPERSPGGETGVDRRNEEPRSGDATPRGEGGEKGSSGSAGSEGDPGLEERVVDVLEREAVLSWEELVAEITDDIERQLDDAIQSLQTENRVRYSGREGGYTVADRP